MKALRLLVDHPALTVAQASALTDKINEAGSWD